jgi:hypothetical protein
VLSPANNSYAGNVPKTRPYCPIVLMPKANRKRFWIALAGIVLAGLTIILLKYYRDNLMERPWSLITPSERVPVVTQIAMLRKDGRFDDAIELGLRSINGHTGDDFIYQDIATTYFIRSVRDKEQSGKWARLGGEYTEKAFNANPTDIANAFNVGINYMVVGDDIDTGGCQYYRKAANIFESLVPRLQGETAETQGRTVRLAPFRKENDEYVSMLKSRLRRCP